MDIMAFKSGDLLKYSNSTSQIFFISLLKHLFYIFNKTLHTDLLINMIFLFHSLTLDILIIFLIIQITLTKIMPFIIYQVIIKNIKT